MTRRHKQIVAALKAGHRLWRYSTERTGYLYLPEGYQRVRQSTLEEMEDAGLIEVDPRESTFREGSGSDNVYRLVVPKSESP
jgi:hypothetical protein